MGQRTLTAWLLWWGSWVALVGRQSPSSKAARGGQGLGREGRWGAGAYCWFDSVGRHPLSSKALREGGGGQGGCRGGGSRCLLLVCFGGEAGPSSKAAGGYHLQALPQETLCTVDQAETCQIHPIQDLHPHAHICPAPIGSCYQYTHLMRVSLQDASSTPAATSSQLCPAPVNGYRDCEIVFLFLNAGLLHYLLVVHILIQYVYFASRRLCCAPWWNVHACHISVFRLQTAVYAGKYKSSCL